MYKIIDVVDLDLSESTDRYYSIQLRGIRDDNFDTEDTWWAIFDFIDEKIYGYEYITKRAKGLRHDDHFSVHFDDNETVMANIYIYKTPEYGKLVDDRYMYLEEYIVNDNTLIESCKKEVIESMI